MQFLNPVLHGEEQLIFQRMPWNPRMTRAEDLGCADSQFQSVGGSGCSGHKAFASTSIEPLGQSLHASVSAGATPLFVSFWPSLPSNKLVTVIYEVLTFGALS